jgi:hypothetical protein
MNLGEIRVFRFKRAQGGAEAISTNLGIDAPAQFVVVDEKMVIILDVVVAIVHVPYRKAFLFEAIEVPLGPVPRLLAVRVQPDPVGPARPVPGVQRANGAPAVITQPAGWRVGPRGGCIGQAFSAGGAHA